MNSIIKDERMYSSVWDDGNYTVGFRVLKYDSGFMMIFCSGDLEKKETTFTIQFPVPFASDSLCIMHQTPNDYGQVFCGIGGTTSFTVVWRDKWGNYETGDVQTFYMIAIGRWK